MIFSAAPPPASVAAALATVEIMEREPDRRTRLWENARFFSEGLKSLGLDTAGSQTPVVPVVVGEDHVALAMASPAEHLQVGEPVVGRGAVDVVDFQRAV